MSSTTHLKSILLVGVTGPFSFGQFVIRALLPSLTSFNRIAIYHDTSRPTDATKQALLNQFSSAKLEIITGNGYNSPSSYKDFDAVLIFLGNHGLHLQPTLIDAAISAGVRHFYPSEFGADLTVGLNRHQRYYVHKIKTREHLEFRAKDIPDLSWTFFTVGRLTEWSVTPHFGLNNRDASAKIYGTAEGRQSLISANDAALFVVESLKTPLPDNIEERRRTIRVSGEDISYASFFDIIEKVTGRRYDVTYLDVEKAQIEEKEAKDRGDIDAELAASHKLIQGREGTLLPKPWDNEMWPAVKVVGVEEALSKAFAHPKLRKAYGLD